jgi:hypothetical protein
VNVIVIDLARWPAGRPATVEYMGGGLEMLVCDDAARTDQSEQTNKH